MLEVLEQAPDEVEAPCPHFGSCGGCTYLALPYEKQLALKEKQVKELLDSVLCRQEEPWVWEPIKASPRQLGYRNKMEFFLRGRGKGRPPGIGNA